MSMKRLVILMFLMIFLVASATMAATGHNERPASRTTQDIQNRTLVVRPPQNQGTLVRVYNDPSGFFVNNGEREQSYSPGGTDGDAVISPNGRYIAYTGWFWNEKTGEFSHPVFVMDLRTGTQTILSLARVGKIDLSYTINPCFSRDGRDIIASAWVPEIGAYKLFRTRVRGHSLPKRVASDNSNTDEFNSATGPGFIVYEAVPASGGAQIWRCDESTGRSTPLAVGPSGPEQFREDPTVSPDGLTVAFTHWAGGDMTWIYTIPAFAEPGEGELLYAFNCRSPFWLPDGTIDVIHPELWRDLSDVWHYGEALTNLAPDQTSIATILVKPELANPSGAFVNRGWRIRQHPSRE